MTLTWSNPKANAAVAIDSMIITVAGIERISIPPIANVETMAMSMSENSIIGITGRERHIRPRSRNT